MSNIYAPLTQEATQTPAATPNKTKKRIVSTIVTILIVYVALALLDALGLFVMGTYKFEVDSELLSTESEIVLEFGGKWSGEDVEPGSTYKLEGDHIILIEDGDEMVGSISNGVIKVDVFGLSFGFCKDGKTEDDFGEFSLIDTLRDILSPLSKVFSDIIY